jgi:hypothetical protein
MAMGAASIAGGVGAGAVWAWSSGAESRRENRTELVMKKEIKPEKLPSWAKKAAEKLDSRPVL